MLEIIELLIHFIATVIKLLKHEFLACCELRSLTQIQISSPYQLPGAYPAHGCQEGCPLTIIAPGQNGPLLHCQDRSLFRSLGSSDDTDAPIRMWATLSRNFVSNIRNSHRAGYTLLNMIVRTREYAACYGLSGSQER